MASVSGVNSIIATFKKLFKQSKRRFRADVTVGFVQGYALVVHELTTWKHRVGQAKYLEQPFRQMKDEIRRDVRAMVKRGSSVLAALLFVGMKVQEEAQELTPVDTGALQSSAFTCDTKKVDAVSEAAYRKAERLRARVLARRARGGP